MTVFALDFLHDCVEFMHLARTEHKVDMRCPLNELVSFLLSHAAGDAENQLRILALGVFYLTDFAIDLILRRFAYGTGVDD